MINKVENYYKEKGIMPVFKNTDIGNIYMIKEISSHKKYKFPKQFIGFSDLTERFYLFDLLFIERSSEDYLDDYDYFEYIVLELNQDNINELIRGCDLRHLYIINKNNIYSFLMDKIHMNYFEKTDVLSVIEEDMMFFEDRRYNIKIDEKDIRYIELVKRMIG